MTTLFIGNIIADKYKLDAPISIGTLSHVYSATHLGLGRRVAVKILPISAHTSQTTILRFEQEAMLLSQLRDPHTITLYDYGKLGNQGLFMVFEFIEGLSLKELIEREGPVEPARCAKILKQTLASLQEAHAFGVLHRDIKPANIMVYTWQGDQDRVKVIDFGIAKLLQEAEAELAERPKTADGSVVGTLRYLPPEALNHPIQYSPAYDLYNLGLVGYELLTGYPAIRGKSVEDRVRQLISKTPLTLPDELQLPYALRATIERCLSKQPEARYQSAQDALRALSSQAPPPASAALASAPTQPQPQLNAKPQAEQAFISTPTMKMLVDPIAAGGTPTLKLHQPDLDEHNANVPTQKLFLEPTLKPAAQPLSQDPRTHTKPLFAAPRQSMPEALDLHRATPPIASEDSSPPATEAASADQSSDALLRGQSATKTDERERKPLTRKIVVDDELPFERKEQERRKRAKQLPAVHASIMEAPHFEAPAPVSAPPAAAPIPAHRPLHQTAPHAAQKPPLEPWIKALLGVSVLIFLLGAFVLAISLLKLLKP